MKKLLLTLIVSIVFGGSVFAQYNSDVYTSHWIDQWDVDNYCPYEDYDYIIPFLTIDGEYITLDVDYEAIEIAAFIDGECRGHSFLIDDGETWPFTELAVYRNLSDHDQVITFALWDHANSLGYTGTTTLLNGQEYNYQELYFSGDYDLVPVINFTPDATGIELTINPNQWYLISTPSNVNPSEVTNMLENTYDLYYFDQKGDSEGKEWINRKASETEINEFNLELGHGYLYANSGDGEGETYTLTFPSDGAYAETTLPVDLDYFTDNEDETMHGWNIVGNPYNATATLDKPFYRLEGGIFNPYDAGTAVDALEGALVKAEAAGETVNITMGESAKKALLALNLTEGGNLVDRAIVGFGQGSNLPKFQFNNSSKVYFPMEGKEYAIVRSEGMGEMPVSFKAESNGTYNLNLSTENVEFSYLHLIDNLTGADQDLLANPSYSFSANTTDYASRFRLVFATGSDEDNFAFFSNGSLFVNNEGIATLQVVDVTGRIIMSESINGSANVNIDAAPGVYMVRLVNGDNMKVQKVVK